MKLSTNQDHLIVRLEPGDDVIPSLEGLCRQRHIRNAIITGIGSVEDPKLAHYRMDQKKYTEKAFKGIFEIASLIGNVAVFEGKPLAHIHVVVSDSGMQTRAGHLVSAKCSATLELILRPISSHYQKKLDNKIGLKVWDLPI